MPFEIQGQQVNTDNTIDFSFSGAVQKSCVGFSKFYFTYPDNDSKKVQQISLDLQTTVNGSDTVSVDVQATLQNNGSERIDNSSSYVNVVSMALTETNDPVVVMQNVNNVNDSAPATVETYGTGAYGEGLFLSGFDMSFNGTDHELYRVSASVYGTAGNNTEEIEGTATMENSKGDSNDVGTINAGFIDTPSTANYYAVYSLGNFSNNSTATVDGFPSGYDWSNCQVVISKFQAGYENKQHKVTYLGAGVDSWSYDEETNTLTLTNVGAWIGNNTAKEDDDDESYCSVTLYAIAPLSTN